MGTTPTCPLFSFFSLNFHYSLGITMRILLPLCVLAFAAGCNSTQKNENDPSYMIGFSDAGGTFGDLKKAEPIRH
ncbi:hypothetical protein GCM10007390_04790 [Persicitalea jodogahamensis]|uniref:Uncharacterized protein n=2 Tax=Persicitalea jodogahamensis TaxID=402147 RepID=A0A8J3D711_9BACT|nr:hypothetical protein GCM10007390_04790 [Persicitalea jodogahamensis]